MEPLPWRAGLNQGGSHFHTISLSHFHLSLFHTPTPSHVQIFTIWSHCHGTQIIENAFSKKRGSPKNPAKAISENSDIKACEKCEYKNSKTKQMSEHVLVKHFEVEIYCTKCTYQHRFATKVRTHFKFVHMGITQRNLNCKNAQCLRFGTTECTLLEDHILYH